MTPRLVELSVADIEAVAHGRPTPATLASLRRGQLSKRRLLLRNLRVRLEEAGQDIAEPVGLIDRASLAAPDETDRVFGAPLMNAWMIAALRAVRDRSTVDEAVGLLGSVAVAAAARSGIEFVATVPVRQGSVWLPTLGIWPGVAAEHAVVRGGADGIVVSGGGRVAQRWATRSIGLDADRQSWSLEIEDLDPYRSCFDHQPADRLSDLAVERLTHHVRQAWTVMVRDHPADALVAHATLRGLVPLRPGPDGALLSAASQVAYGCIALSGPPDPSAVVQSLLHEVRHMVLGGLLDVVDLYEDDATVRWHAPWRLDARPIGPLLQGSYAHVGVTEFWQARLRREPVGSPARTRAEFEFAFWREVTSTALATLRGSGQLTAAGVRFVAGVDDAMEACRAEPVPPRVVVAVSDVARADAVLWRLLNQGSSAESLQRLHGDLRADSPCEDVGPAIVRSGPPMPARRRGLARYIQDNLLGDGPLDAIPHADRAFLDGDLQRAVSGYHDRIDADPSDDDAWVGLALSLHQLGVEPAATAMTTRPDIVRALYDGSPVTTPVDTASWVASGLELGC